MNKNPRTKSLHTSLVHWFQPAARPMPWRTTDLTQKPDPYGVWISEIMLQQTQVPTVIPYWTNWMHRWPNISSLAAASEEDVIHLWEGLGYYNRARNILKTAHILMDCFGGKFPTDPKKILQLPGIGPYTVGAIASIAYNSPEPILDGNVIRVLCRVYAIAKPTADTTTRKELWELSKKWVQHAASLHSPSPCSAFNQAMMDLGATICTSASPNCLLCPLRNDCDAFAAGKQTSYPQPKHQPTTIHREDVALLVRTPQNAILLQKRPGYGHNHDFWQLPLLENTSLETSATAFAAQGLLQTSTTPIASLVHSITRYHITLHLCEGTVKAPIPTTENLRFVTPEELNTLPVTSSHRKLLRALR